MIDYQSRLATIQDNIRRKVMDKNVEFVSLVTDCIRIKENKNREGDVESRIVESADIVSIAFPPLKEVPLRDIISNEGTSTYSITSLVTAVGEKPLEVYKIKTPRDKRLQVGDLIFRIFLEPDCDYPIVLGLQVTEKLGTLGANSFISNSYHCTIYTEELPQKLVDVITEMAKRRLFLNF